MNKFKVYSKQKMKKKMKMTPLLGTGCRVRGVNSQVVSEHPGSGLDPPIGSDRRRGVIKVVLRFIRSNIFSRFRTPREVISDEGSHFCNKVFASLLAKYRVKHQVSLAYHP